MKMKKYIKHALISMALTILTIFVISISNYTDYIIELKKIAIASCYVTAFTLIYYMSFEEKNTLELSIRIYLKNSAVIALLYALFLVVIILVSNAEIPIIYLSLAYILVCIYRLQISILEQMKLKKLSFIPFIIIVLTFIIIIVTLDISYSINFLISIFVSCIISAVFLYSKMEAGT